MNVKGYFYWAAFDDMEWGPGFNARFGLYFVDYNDNFNRIPKQSAKWYHDFLKCNMLGIKNNIPRTCEMQNGEEHTKEKIHTTQKFTWFTTWVTSTELQRSFTIK